MDDDSTANDAAWSDELDEIVVRRALRVALSVSLEVAEIAYVTVAVFWCTVLFVIWVDCVDSLVSWGLRYGLSDGLTVWSRTCASIGVVTVSVDVDAALCIGIIVA